MNEVGVIGLGYTDFIAQALQQDGFLTSFNKGFAMSGYTTKNVLADLQNDVAKTVTGFGYTEEQAKLRASIKEAEIITLTAGANDLLPILKESQTTGIDTVAIIKATKEAVLLHSSHVLMNHQVPHNRFVQSNLVLYGHPVLLLH